MRKTVGILVGILCIGSAVAWACGNLMAGLKPGNKVLGIEMKPAGLGGPVNGKSDWVMDDDGLLVISLMAAHCNSDIPAIKPEVTQEQIDCSEKAQDNAKIEYRRRLNLKYYEPSDVTFAEVMDLVNKACNLNIEKIMWAAKKKVFDMPLACAKEVNWIAKKAAARNAAYVNEQLANVPKMNISEEQKKTVTANLKMEKSLSQDFVVLTGKTPVSVGEFKDWLDGLKEIADEKAYQKVGNPDDPFNAALNVPLKAILSDMGAPLPFVGRSRCGPPFPKDIVKRLESATWELRGSGPGTQGGTQEKAKAAE